MDRTNDVHKKKTAIDILGVGLDKIDYDEIDRVTKSLRQPITLTLLDEIPKHLLVRKTRAGKQWNRAVVIAAAGPETVAQSKLKVMSDPLLPKTRKDLTECAISEPNLSSSINRRTDSLYEDGFNLELEIVQIINPETGKEYEPEKKAELLKPHLKIFLPHLARLANWSNKMNVLDAMRDAAAVSFVQGKNGTMMLPGILDLKPGALPLMVETIHADDLKEPIVNVGLTRKIVAVKTNLDGKRFCRADELVYVVRGSKKALRRDGKFFGMPEIESILIISQILKRIYNYDFAQAATAAYVTKVLFHVLSEGNEERLENRVKKLLADYANNGTIAFATFDGVTATPVESKVNFPMLNGLEDNLARKELAITGVPSSMMNREQNLNRDLATIQVIQFIKFIRGPDEKLIAKFFEDQMFNRLLAHLAGVTEDQLPVRIRIVRKKSDKDIDKLEDDSLAEKKQGELDKPDLSKQPIESSVFAAGGPESINVTPDGKGGYDIKRNSPNS